MKDKSALKIEEITQKKVEEIALDFIVNNKSQSQLQKEYNLSAYFVRTLVEEMNLIKKREKYKEKVLDKSLEKCSNYQAKIIYKATELIHQHIDKLYESQKESDSPILNSAEIRDVMAILQMISKEHRLDHDKPTDRSVKEVMVSFPEGFVPITHNRPTIVEDVEFKEVKKEKDSEEESEDKEEIEVKIDDKILGNPLG